MNYLAEIFFVRIRILSYNRRKFKNHKMIFMKNIIQYLKILFFFQPCIEAKFRKPSHRKKTKLDTRNLLADSDDLF